jgi:hypothetical protein
MTFFVTSEGSGKGADQRCQMLAAGVGAGNRTWHAYLSTQAVADKAAPGQPDHTGGPNTSWNSAHGSRGCSQESLKTMGGAGLFYCFAAE